jgi:hypothetical protein
METHFTHDITNTYVPPGDRQTKHQSGAKTLGNSHFVDDSVGGGVGGGDGGAYFDDDDNGAGAAPVLQLSVINAQGVAEGGLFYSTVRAPTNAVQHGIATIRHGMVPL